MNRGSTFWICGFVLLATLWAAASAEAVQNYFGELTVHENVRDDGHITYGLASYVDDTHGAGNFITPNGLVVESRFVTRNQRTFSSFSQLANALFGDWTYKSASSLGGDILFHFTISSIDYENTDAANLAFDQPANGSTVTSPFITSWSPSDSTSGGYGSSSSGVKRNTTLVNPGELLTVFNPPISSNAFIHFEASQGVKLYQLNPTTTHAGEFNWGLNLYFEKSVEITVYPSAVPEPCSLSILGLAALAAVPIRRR